MIPNNTIACRKQVISLDVVVPHPTSRGNDKNEAVVEEYGVEDMEETPQAHQHGVG